VRSARNTRIAEDMARSMKTVLVEVWCQRRERQRSEYEPAGSKK